MQAAQRINNFTRLLVNTEAYPITKPQSRGKLIMKVEKRATVTVSTTEVATANPISNHFNFINACGVKEKDTFYRTASN